MAPVVGFTGNGNEGLSRPHNDRLGQVHPSALAHYGSCDESQAFAGVGVDFENGNRLAGYWAFEVESWNDPVVAEAEGEVRFVVKRQHDQSPIGDEAFYPFGYGRVFPFLLATV